MGACAILPRIIGQGRAGELLYTGRFMDGAEAERWGFYNALADPGDVLARATRLAEEIAAGPTVAHAVTKKSLHDEWNMSVDEAIAYEAAAQARCMETGDFARAYRAFMSKDKRPPPFEGD
jgi:enoyl-CoA hydratase/carnithine racemase